MPSGLNLVSAKAEVVRLLAGLTFACLLLTRDGPSYSTAVARGWLHLNGAVHGIRCSSEGSGLFSKLLEGTGQLWVRLLFFDLPLVTLCAVIIEGS